MLNHLTRRVHGEDATYLCDALTTLRIAEPDAVQLLDDDLRHVAAMLEITGKPALNAAYEALVAAVRKLSPRVFPKAHNAYTARLRLLQSRLTYRGQLTKAMSIHQAKGREWDQVGIRLSGTQKTHLQAGLDVAQEEHRKVYVACTRARVRTISV